MILKLREYIIITTPPQQSFIYPPPQTRNSIHYRPQTVNWHILLIDRFLSITRKRTYLSLSLSSPKECPFGSLTKGLSSLEWGIREWAEKTRAA